MTTRKTSCQEVRQDLRNMKGVFSWQFRHGYSWLMEISLPRYSSLSQVRFNAKLSTHSYREVREPIVNQCLVQPCTSPRVEIELHGLALHCRTRSASMTPIAEAQYSAGLGCPLMTSLMPNDIGGSKGFQTRGLFVDAASEEQQRCATLTTHREI